MVRLSWGIAGLGLLLLLTGCGGGSSSGGGSGGESARSLLTLNAENSPTVVSTAWSALASGDILFGDDLLPLQATVTEAEGSMTVRQLSILREVTAATLGYFDKPQTFSSLAEPDDGVVLPQRSETFPCTVSGSVVISETSATEGSIEFRDCTEFDGAVYVRLNGKIELSNAQFSEGSCVESFSGIVRFRDLFASVHEDLAGAPVDSVLINGSTNFSEVDNYCDGTYYSRFEGQRLRISTMNESVGYFNFDIRGNDVGSYMEDDVRVTLDVDSLPGSVGVTTPQPLISFWYDDYPHAGQVRLSAAGGGYLQATVNSSSGFDAVSIVGDFNDNGIPDCQAQVSWQQIVTGSWACGSP